MMVAPSSASSRIRRATSKPSISGMFASSRTSANGRPCSLRLEQRAQRRGAALDDGRPHLPAEEQIVQHAPVHAVVVHDQHGQIGEVDGGRLRARVGEAETDGEVERAAFVRRAFEPHPAAHQIDERRRDRQAEPRAAEPARRRSVGLPERLENRALLVLRNADAAVADEVVQHGGVGRSRLRLRPAPGSARAR